MLEKGAKVRILRKESYWYRDTGIIVKVDRDIKYPVLVRFIKQSYSGVNSNNFADDELEIIE